MAQFAPLDPNEGYPGIRYAMLHTLSHLLIRELALECGYNAASIRERIYADTSGANPQQASSSTRRQPIPMGRWWPRRSRQPDNLGRLLRQR
jgi:hypothetical protein